MRISVSTVVSRVSEVMKAEVRADPRLSEGLLVRFGGGDKTVTGLDPAGAVSGQGILKDAASDALIREEFFEQAARRVLRCLWPVRARWSSKR